ncbi:unnamed protein product [Clonostachys chloroleuca]|uniref:Uncharacterized protein n=1 Tax=Clonostachys chloroleuca TaxID=1926264 RepID=A0AA35LT74_9HYPO|nr:unnamed protein product [Clonostachys chloroleuca]
MDNRSPPPPYSFRDIPSPHSPYSFSVIASPLYDNYSPRTSTHPRPIFISLIDSESENSDREDEDTDGEITWEDVILDSNPEITVNDGVAEDAANDAEGDAVNDGVADAINDAERDAINDAEGDAANDAEGDAVNDGVADAINDAEGDAVNDAEGDAINDAEEDAINDAEGDAINDAEGDAVNETAADAFNGSVHPLNGQSDDGKPDHSEIKRLKADFATALDIILGIKAKMDQIPDVKLPKKVRFDSILPKKDQSNHPNSSRKRKSPMTPCTVPETKKRRRHRQVNVRPIRATVDGEFTCLWQRGKSGKYCWVSDPNGTERKELDGEFLFLHGSMLSVELRGNGDWQPISVRLNENNDRYEGRDSLDSNTRLDIDANTMFDLLRGVRRSHVGHIGKLR